MSAAITLQPTSVTEYKKNEVQTVGTARLGYQGGDYPGYHDIVVELDLPRALKSLTVYQDWSGREPSNAYPTYGARIVQESLTAFPGEADATFKFSSGNDATVTINKKLSKGKWYLWFGRPRDGGSVASFVYGGRSIFPKLEITGETAGGVVRVAVDGEVKEAVPKVYKDGVWKDPIPKFYKNGTWEEMS